MDDYGSEIQKYRKKKPSVSSTSKKSKHKHMYRDCLLVAENRPHKAQYCTICGKIGNIEFFETEKVDTGYGKAYRMLTDTEIYDKYKNIVKFEIEFVFQKYVIIPIISGKENDLL